MEGELNVFEGIEELEWSTVGSGPDKQRKEPDFVEEADAGTSKEVAGKSEEKTLYSEVLKGNGDDKEEEERKERPNYSRYDYRRKNVVRLHYTGENIPDRDIVGKDLIIGSLRFSPAHVFAFIHISGTRDYDISFRNVVFLDLFWTRFEEARNDRVWKDFEVVKISENGNRNITILFKTETVPAMDIVFWLRKRCKEVGPLKPIYDKNGFWIGGYKVVVKLRSAERGLDHLPNFITIGSDRGYLFYPGQPKVCHKCGSGRHFGVDCNKFFCVRCGLMGHLAKDCTREVKCNLCGEEGHIYLHCPKSEKNRLPAELLTGFSVEEQMDRDAEAQVALEKEKADCCAEAVAVHGKDEVDQDGNQSKKMEAQFEILFKMFILASN
ncbi:zinc finger CCHC domain-containing protein 3-like [Latimeria chalumnae]|uniref:zinc finger CCHC domain-containing protein 3-like n=1 Tax=Latimeria chalumnae TaxID=7897 RepID=UPI00313A90BF